MFRLPDPSAIASEFGRKGFVVVSGAVPHSTASALGERAERLASIGVSIDRTTAEHRLSYRVVTGDRIERDFPALFSLYRSPGVIDWMRNVTASSTLATSPHLRSSININCLSDTGQQYPWHVDAIPYTALLFLTSVPADAGGQLLVRDLTGELVTFSPSAGDLLVMDGSRCPHAVAPLRRDFYRISVPMVYPIAAHQRPADLDPYLYGNDLPPDPARS
jgi:hypothetical protein